MSVMSAHVWTILFFLAVVSHCCLTAVLKTPGERGIKEQIKKELDASLTLQKNKFIDQTDTKLFEYNDKFSSEENNFWKISNSSSSSSSEDSSSEESNIPLNSLSGLDSLNFQEEIAVKLVKKRSLDEEQDGVNKISDTQNEPQDASSETKTSEDSIVVESEVSTTDTTSTTEEDAPTTPETNENKDESSSPERSSPEPTESDADTNFTEMALARVDKLSDQVKKILMHYRKEGVVVVPGQNIFPEPMTVEDFSKSTSLGQIEFINATVHGLSNFTVEQVNTDIDQMQVFVLLKMKKVVVEGNYTLSSYFSKYSGPFNVTLSDVESEGVALIETTSEGHLEASDSQMDMSANKMAFNFQNLGPLAASFVNTVGETMFESIKPQILGRVNLVIRKDINEKLKTVALKFVNNVPPVDLAFSEGRRYVREHGYEPLNVKQETIVVAGIVHFNITEFSIQGLSRFNKVGNLTLSMDAGIIQFGVHVATQKLTGDFKWSVDAFGISRSGKTNYTIDQLQVRAVVNQSLDVRLKPQLDDLDLHVGWVKVSMESHMALSMMVEGVVNSFPRLIRHMVVDTLEKPLKEKIQEILNEINVESLVENNLPRLDNFGM